MWMRETLKNENAAMPGSTQDTESQRPQSRRRARQQSWTGCGQLNTQSPSAQQVHEMGGVLIFLLTYEQMEGAQRGAVTSEVMQLGSDRHPH